MIRDDEATTLFRLIQRWRQPEHRGDVLATAEERLDGAEPQRCIAGHRHSGVGVGIIANPAHHFAQVFRNPTRRSSTEVGPKELGREQVNQRDTIG